ncbi:hypothetical protein Pint_34793 [Pistacia integerrima]|uniref:Uncharacterized protein n=1 Tax=Pistacia integerrima TaxID=434235 RepID=A0ACC0X7B0_9ROSI|nr:hypothetical protein Pint_34793 [Pistacia integerrima]
MAIAVSSRLLLGFIFLVLEVFQPATASSNVYIVYLGDINFDEFQLTQDLHHEILSNILGSKEAAKESILYSYKHGFSGFAAVLTESQAKLIADIPGVVRVIPNKILDLQTTRSWDFLQVKPYIENGIISKSHSGSGSIIGVIDTGIWPESESFSDNGMGEIPSGWNGICQEGEGFNHSNCNRKIIGARWYIKGYEAEFGKLNTSDGVEFLSPRDAVGHGTHTASTAAGASVKNASFMGLAQGIARGGAPLASLAVYKVCWATGGCSSADLLAAFDDAVSDGVNVLSVSLGSSPPLSTYFDDVLSIGSFHAAAKGIAIVCSAGNSGPYPQTVINTAPWIITVAASTIDRSFPTAITMGNNQTVVGQAFYTGRMDMNKFYPIVYGEDIAAIDADEDSASSCDSGTLNATLARGKIVICFQSRSQRNPLVKFSFTKTVIGQQLSPEVAFFSSRGPSSLSPSVLKPDITAPGVNVLASWSPASSPDTDNSIPPLNFKIESGTSMSCPHVSGIVALLKGKYQTWSPAAIKSALITTASLKDEYDQIIVSEGAPHKQADPFDYGGGHVNPNKAMDPGLIYDMGVSDYVHFLCGMGYNNSAISSMTKTQTRCFRKSTGFLANLNLPSITIPELKKSLTVSRTVTNVGPVNSVYTARVQTPAGATVGVEPSTLTFNPTVKTLKFKVTFRSQLRVQGRYSFGYLFWEDGLHHVVRIPLIVRTVIDDFYSQT